MRCWLLIFLLVSLLLGSASANATTIGPDPGFQINSRNLTLGIVLQGRPDLIPLLVEALSTAFERTNLGSGTPPPGLSRIGGLLFSSSFAVATPPPAPAPPITTVPEPGVPALVALGLAALAAARHGRRRLAVRA